MKSAVNWIAGAAMVALNMISLGISPAQAAVDMNTATCNNAGEDLGLKYVNNTPDPWDMRGWNMSIGTGTNTGKFPAGSGGSFFVAPGATAPVNFAGCGANKGTPFNKQLQAKIGSCNEPTPPSEPIAMTCAEINASATFYKADQCIQDGLGINRGDGYGGFIDSYRDQTQIQVAIPTNTFTMGTQTVRFDPAASMGGPMYMMSMVALQEYLYVDMQFLMAMGASTSGAGLVDASGTSLYKSPPNTGTGTSPYGSFTVTYETAVGRLMADYPKYFQNGALVMEKLVSTGGSVVTAPNSPQQMNSGFFAAMNLWWIFDGLKSAQDLCFKQFLQESKDKSAGLKLMLGGYHIGPNVIDNGTGADDYANHVLPTTSAAILNAPDVTPFMKAFPWDNGTPPGPDHNTRNYITRVFSVVDQLVQANPKSTACGGALNIYDAGITLTQIQELFFGQGGTAATQGNGGLLWHFNIDAASRTALWNDLQCSFDQLKGKAPGRAANEISYRYDFLTVLRVARQYFAGYVNKFTDRPTPASTYSSDYSIWVYNHSQVPCTRTVQDLTWPVMTFADSVYRKGDKLTGTFTDDTGIKEYAYTTDIQWRKWSATDASFVIPTTLADTDKLWFRITDSCGNATIQQVTVKNVPPKPVAGIPIANPKAATFTGAITVALSDTTPGASIFYTTDGSLPATSATGATKLYVDGTPISIGSSLTLKAIATKLDYTNSGVMIEPYTINIPPNAPTKAWYLDKDGDGRIESVVLLFDKDLAAIPAKLAFKITDENGKTEDRSAAGGEIAFAAGSKTQVNVSLSNPFTYGITSVTNAASSGQTFQQTDIPLADAAFAVADSVPPVIMAAEVKEAEGALPKRVELTYSESVVITAGGAQPLIWKQETAEVAPAKINILGTDKYTDKLYIFRFDSTSTYLPVVGDSVSIAPLAGTADKFGLTPIRKLFHLVAGIVPPAKPVELYVTFPNGKRDQPSHAVDAGNQGFVLIPISQGGTALAGTADGKCGSCNPGKEGEFAGPVIYAQIPQACDYDIRIFSNLGEFLARVKGKLDETDVKQLQQLTSVPGAPYQARFVWTGRDALGTLAGTGAYVLDATFTFGRNTKTGAAPSVQTKRTRFGLIRSTSH